MILSEDKIHLLAIEEKDINSSGTLKIPEGITVIGWNATGEGFANLKTVLCPSTLKEIGASAFKDCTHLTSVLLKKPEALIHIRSGAFEGCVNLRAFPFEKTVFLETIGMSAFRGSGLLHIDFASHGPKLIQANAFSNCKHLMWAKLGTRLSLLGSHCFADDNLLKTVTILSENLSAIHDYVFRDCSKIENFICYGNPAHISDKSFDAVNIAQVKTRKHIFSLPEINTEIIRTFLKEGNGEE